MQVEFHDFLRFHTRIEPKFNFVKQCQSDLKINSSDLERLLKMKEIMDTLMRIGHLKNAREAFNELSKSINEWEANGRKFH